MNNGNETAQRRDADSAPTNIPFTPPSPYHLKSLQMSFPLPIHHSRLPGPPAIPIYPSISRSIIRKNGQQEMHAKVDPPSQIAKPPSVLK
jgi:hypothetical protein